jgi:tetratricopeptide (TPR) repeat protein
VNKPAVAKQQNHHHAAPSFYSRAAKEAERKIQDHDLASAVNIWSTELEARPENAESWVGRASVKRMIGDYQGAHDDLEHALELNPSSVPALISRAAVRRRLADLRGAARDIDKAVELAPRNYQAFAERSSLRFALNDMQGAMADYNYALTLNPEMNKQVAKYSYSANSQPQLVIRDARDVTKREVRTADSRAVDNRSSDTKNSDTKNSDTRTGETRTGDARASDARNSDARNSEARISDSRNTDSKNTDSKSNDTRAGDSKNNDNGEPHYTNSELAHLNNTAVHEINVKHFASAIKAFERLLQISPNYAHAKDNLVIAHNNYGLELAMRKPPEALKQFRAALYLDPCQAAIRKNLSAIMRENGQDPESSEDRLVMADQCLSQGDAEGAFVELSEALRIKNTPQLREKLQIALAAINSSDVKNNQSFSQKEKSNPSATARTEAKLELKAEAGDTKTETRPDTRVDARIDVKTEATVDSSNKNADSSMPPPTILGALQSAIPESRSTMTTIADLPQATLRTREPVALRPVRDMERAAIAPVQLESPSAAPGFDAAFVKSTLDNTPETVLQVARQLASENRELDAEALLNRLGDILRKKSLKGDKSAEAMLENTLEALSELYFKSNRLQNAEPTLRELVAIREKTKSPDDHILGKTLAEYSMVLKSLGRTDEAAKHEQKANLILNQISAH